MSLVVPIAETLSLFAKEPIRLEAEAGVSFSEVLGSEYDNPDLVISTRGLDVYREMRRDDALGAFMKMKKAARLSTGWKIIPASDSREDLERAEFIREAFKQMKGTVKSKVWNILTALDFGFSITNRVASLLEVGPFKGKIYYRDLKSKEPDDYIFELDKYKNIKGLTHTTPGYKVEHLKIEDFVHYPYRSEFNNPYGESDCRACYKPWVEKKYINKFDLIYLERFAGGFLWVTFEEPINKKNHEKMQALIDGLQARTAILAPKNYKGELVEASGRGSEVYREEVKSRNIAMARAVLVPDLLGFSERPTGSYALGRVHFDVFLSVLDDLGGDIEEEIFNEQIIKPLIDLNYGPGGYPRFQFEELTIESKLQILEKLISSLEKGAITKDENIEIFVREALGLEPKKEGEEDDKDKKPPREPGIPTEEDVDTGDDEITIPGEGKELSGRQGSPLARTFQPRRDLTKYEAKTDFERIVRASDALEDALVEQWAAVLTEARTALIGYTRKNKIVEEGNEKAIEDLRFPKSSDLRKSLGRFSLASFYDGALEGQTEVLKGARTQNIKVPEKFTGTSSFAVPTDPTGATIDEIEKAFLSKGLVLSPAIKTAARETVRRAFFISDVEAEKLLLRARAVLYSGIRRGNLAWTEKELKKIFDGYIETGEITNAKLGTHHRIETIARTNFTTAFNDGRRAKFTDPEIEEFIEAYQWSSVIDDASTDYCRSMDQRILRKEDLNVEGWPPGHYNCRSIVIPIVRGEEFKYNRVTTVERGRGFHRLEGVSYAFS